MIKDKRIPVWIAVLILSLSLLSGCVVGDTYRIEEKAYERGYEAGYNKGYDDGYDDGTEAGYDDGYYDGKKGY